MEIVHQATKVIEVTRVRLDKIKVKGEVDESGEASAIAAKGGGNE